MKKKSKFWDFEKAREFVHGLKIQTQKEWKEYCKSGHKNCHIPTNPWCVYTNQWVNLFDWTGRKEERYWSNRKYKVNHDFFKKWSPDMSYVLGLWFADGWISRYKNHQTFAIALNEKDKCLLEMVLKIMDSDYILHYRKTNSCYYFHISSKQILDDVIDKGGMCNKSLKVLFPKVPNKYLRHFIRGYFDGDGCISYCTTNDRYSSSFTSGSYKFIKNLQKVIEDNVLGIKCTLSKYSPRKFTIRGKNYQGTKCYYELRFGFRDTVLLGDFIYRDSHNKLRMDRKYEKYLEAKILREKYVEEKRIR